MLIHKEISEVQYIRSPLLVPGILTELNIVKKQQSEELFLLNLRALIKVVALVCAVVS